LIAFTVLPLLLPNNDVVILAECETDVDAFLRALLHTLSSFPPAECTVSLSFLSAPEKNFFDSLFAAFAARIIIAPLVVALRLVTDVIIIIIFLRRLKVVLVLLLFWWWCEVDAALLKAIQSRLTNSQPTKKTNWMHTPKASLCTRRRRRPKTELLCGRRRLCDDSSNKTLPLFFSSQS
jgi:hypothetical protein